MFDVKATIIFGLCVSVGLVAYGVFGIDDLPLAVAVISVGFAVFSLAAAFTVHRESQKTSGKQKQHIDTALVSLHEDVKAIKAHLTVPDNVEEARQLADRVRAVDWKVDALRHRPWWKIARP